jgi:hypothetical protein
LRDARYAPGSAQGAVDVPIPAQGAVNAPVFLPVEILNPARAEAALTRIWAARGTRPRAPRDTRYQWAYLFGAVCPARGIAAGLVLPCVNTPAMNAHLAEIDSTVAPGAHAGVDWG